MFWLFVKSVISGGFLKSYGIFFSAFIETFGRTASETQLVRSARSLSSTLTGPFGTALSERLTERVVIMAGAVIMALGFILCFFVDSLEMLIFCFGIFSGVGVSLINGPSKVCVGRYFDKRRGLANSLTLVGTAIGQIAMPPLVSILMATYSLRGTMLIYGGLCLNIIIVGALMRPLASYPTGTESEVKSVDNASSNSGEKDSAVDLCEGSDVDQSSNSSTANDVTIKTKNTQEHRNESAIENLTNSRLSKVDTGIQHRRVSTSAPQITEHHVEASASNGTDISTLVEDAKIELLIAPQQKSGCSVFVKVLTFLKGIFDRRVLTNPLYILFIACTSICMSAAVNQTTFIVPRAEEVGISRQMAAILLSLIGGCDVVGRILLGVLADIKRLSPHHAMAGGVMVTSVCMYALPFAQSFTEMAVIAVIFGLFGSSHAILNLPVMVDFVGKDLLAKAVGMSIFFYGGFGAILAPLLGLVKDRMGSFSTVFYVTASMQMLAAILLTTVEPLLRRRIAAKPKSHHVHC